MRTTKADVIHEDSSDEESPLWHLNLFDSAIESLNESLKAPLLDTPWDFLFIHEDMRVFVEAWRVHADGYLVILGDN